jgi:hypothetical protein
MGPPLDPELLDPELPPLLLELDPEPLLELPPLPLPLPLLEVDPDPPLLDPELPLPLPLDAGLDAPLLDPEPLPESDPDPLADPSSGPSTPGIMGWIPSSSGPRAPQPIARRAARIGRCLTGFMDGIGARRVLTPFAGPESVVHLARQTDHAGGPSGSNLSVHAAHGRASRSPRGAGYSADAPSSIHVLIASSVAGQTDPGEVRGIPEP